MIKRNIAEEILRLKTKYPVISVTGPRQSGKTTLVKKLFKEYKYYNLENLDILASAQEDPKSFLQLNSKNKFIIDEIQKFPDLLSYIQTEVDKQDIPAQFIITGSQQFSLSEKISQSLAGRVANFTLLPLSINELEKTKYFKKSHLKLMLTGFYPRIYDKKVPFADYYRDYLFTYIERDVRQIKNIGSLTNFQRFLQLVAGRVGQLVNFSSLANDVGVSYKTIDSWLSVLEASYIIFRLQPYYKNFGKRLIKSPKIYFYDTGLVSYLLGINSIKELKNHFALGNIFENLIIADIAKQTYNARSNSKLYFWRDSRNEVDLIIDQGGQKKAIEIKTTSTYSPTLTKGLRFWQNLKHQTKTQEYLVYTGKGRPLLKSVKIANWLKFLKSGL